MTAGPVTRASATMALTSSRVDEEAGCRCLKVQLPVPLSVPVPHRTNTPDFVAQLSCGQNSALVISICIMPTSFAKRSCIEVRVIAQIQRLTVQLP